MKYTQFKKEIMKQVGIIADEHPDGHQKKKLDRYVVKVPRMVIALEKDLKTQVNIWCPMEVTKYIKGVEYEIYPASELWTTYNAKGDLVYGRHTGIKATKELENADLIKFIIKTTDEAKIVLDGIQKAALDGVV